MRRRLAIGLAGAATLCLPATAAAASHLAIEPSASARFPERTMVLSLPTKQPLTAADVSLRENGRRVAALRVEPVSGSRRTGTVLVIDTSRSMHGEAIRRAMAAARAFARRRPAGAPLGVIFFARTPRLVLAPTTDAARISATLAQTPLLTKGTRALDAAAEGVRVLALAAVPAGSVVLLSDGADVGSATTIEALRAVAHRTRSRIFTVGLASASASSGELAAIARAGHGDHADASQPKDLPRVFAALGDRLASEYLVEYRSTAQLGTNVLVSARVSGIGGRAVTAYDTPRLPLAYRAPAQATQSSGMSETTMAIMIALAALIAGSAAFALARPRPRALAQRIGDFTGTEVAAQAFVLQHDPDSPARPPSPRFKRLADQLELAQIRMGPQRLVIAVAGASVLVAYAAIASGRPALVVLALVVPLAARTVVRVRIARRRRAFDEQLPDNLQLVASALRAGHSFAGALAQAADGASEPSAAELQRAVVDEKVGVSIQDALASVGRRMANDEIEYVGVVARQQSETGGNSAEVLERVVATTRERQQLRREVQTLTAQGRLSGAVVSGLPVAMAAVISILRPGYLAPLYESLGGRLLLIAAAAMAALGWFAIRRIVDIDV
jgi:tight adherence protein B